MYRLFVFKLQIVSVIIVLDFLNICINFPTNTYGNRSNYNIITCICKLQIGKLLPLISKTQISMEFIRYRLMYITNWIVCGVVEII